MESPSSSTCGCHLVAMPYPARGHINPMMNFCKLLVSNNTGIILVTFVVTEEWLGFIGSDPKPDSIRFATIPNVIPSELTRSNYHPSFMEAVMTKMEAPFEELLNRLQPPPTAIVPDTFLYWAVAVGNRRNIPVASFWTMSASIFSVLHHHHLLVQNGHYPVNLSGETFLIMMRPFAPFVNKKWSRHNISSQHAMWWRLFGRRYTLGLVMTFQQFYHALSIVDLFMQNTSLGTSRDTGAWWQTIRCVVAFCVWEKRNAVIFNNEMVDGSKLIEEITFVS